MGASKAPQNKKVHTLTYLRKTVPEIVSVCVSSTELVQVLNDTLSELLVAWQGSIEHQENGSTLEAEVQSIGD